MNTTPAPAAALVDRPVFVVGERPAAMQLVHALGETPGLCAMPLNRLLPDLALAVERCAADLDPHLPPLDTTKHTKTTAAAAHTWPRNPASIFPMRAENAPTRSKIAPIPPTKARCLAGSALASGAVRRTRSWHISQVRITRCETSSTCSIRSPARSITSPRSRP